MLCKVCFDLWVLMRSLKKSTKKPASRYSKVVRDLLAEIPYRRPQQISLSIIDLLSPKASSRLIAHQQTDLSVLNLSASSQVLIVGNAFEKRF